MVTRRWICEMAVVVNDRVRGQWMKLVSRRSLTPQRGWKFVRCIFLSIGMSGFDKSARPVRQLSLQPPAVKRQHVRRQRSAEEDKSLEICASPLARGKRGTSAKLASERPKIRVAWKENRSKDDKEVEQVEVVARQIPGRFRPATGRVKGFVAIDEPSILYSRQELAERLRLAWKQREESKANINIFLAHGSLEDRCDSQMSSHVISSSSPVPNEESSKSKVSTSSYHKGVENELIETSKVSARFRGNCPKKQTEDVDIKQSGSSLKRCNEISDFETIRTLDDNEISNGAKETGREKIDAEKKHIDQQTMRNASVDEHSKKKTSINIDCSNSRVPSKALPSIKIESSALEVEKLSKEDFSSAKQKRASFRSGTNRAFLDPIKSPTIEFRCNYNFERNASNRRDAETKENATNDKLAGTRNVSEIKRNSTNEKMVTLKTIADSKSNGTFDRNARARTIIENKDASTQKISDVNKCNLTVDTANAELMEDKGNENPPSKRIEIQKVDQRPRRTSSAPPQRHVESNLPNNRVQVNIVIDTPNAGTFGKNKGQEKTDMGEKHNAIEITNPTKVTSGRSVRSAPSKRRSRSVRRRYWGSARVDEEGKSRNRSSGRARNSIDSKTMDIVTMVSLISSADSDSDVENSPMDDKLIDELRSKLPTTSIIKTSMNPLCSARKPTKSVSFQKDSFDEDSLRKEQQPPYTEEKKTSQPRLTIVNHRGNGGTLSSNGETVSWRTEIPGLGLPVLALIRDAEETLDVPLTDREKRCLAVPIGDLNDKKRKLLKTRSISSRSNMEKQTMLSKARSEESPRIVPQKIEIPVQQIKTFSDSTSTSAKSSFVSHSKEIVHPTSTEPQFQTNKEKECWHLYRKMCDKGVCVSFDTVLRGMLTPTEYRLRQKELSQNL